MRFGLFVLGAVTVCLLGLAAYWLFLTTQFPAGPANVLATYAGTRWVASAFIWSVGLGVIGAVAGTLFSGLPRAAYACFAVGAVSWLVASALFCAGMIVKMIGQVGPPDAGLTTVLANSAVVAIPFVLLLMCVWLSRRIGARRSQAGSHGSQETSAL